MIAAALIVAGTAAVLWLAWYLVSRPRLVRSKLRSRLVVTLKSGAAFDGVLLAADPNAWVLRDATALGAGVNGADVPVDGELVILSADIEYAQKP